MHINEPNRVDLSSWRIKKWNNFQKNWVTLSTSSQMMMKIGGMDSSSQGSMSAWIWSQVFLQSFAISHIVSTLVSSTFKEINLRVCHLRFTLSKIWSSWIVQTMRSRKFVKDKRLTWAPLRLSKSSGWPTTKLKYYLKQLDKSLLWLSWT